MRTGVRIEKGALWQYNVSRIVHRRMPVFQDLFRTYCENANDFNGHLSCLRGRSPFGVAEARASTRFLALGCKDVDGRVKPGLDASGCRFPISQPPGFMGPGLRLAFAGEQHE
jgi:hypothetical protein